MRHSLRIAIGFFVLVFVAPAPSEAGLFSWLDRLSGPGPFWGVDFGIALRCPDTKDKPNLLEATADIRFSCPGEDLTKRRFNWFMNVGVARASDNDLDYGERSAPAPSKAVNVLKMGTSVDFRPVPSVEVGTGAGFIYFGGPRFVNFARPYFQPLRLSVRPLIIGRYSKRRSALMLQFNLNMIVGTIDGASFGAPADPLNKHNEVLKEYGVGIDFLKLFGH